MDRTMSETPEMVRIRITFCKLDALRFVGHLDLAKTWERVLRRARVPLVYSKGFNPQPRMQLASALPLGVSSECELLDIWLLKDVALEPLPDILNAVSPPGLRTVRVEPVSLKLAALQTLTESADYLISVDGVDDTELGRRIDVFQAADQVLRMRKGKAYDLRPLVLSLGHAEGGTIRARLATGDQGNARPDELLDALGLDFALAHCHRVALYLRQDPAAESPAADTAEGTTGEADRLPI
jgi:radical SAM-linked protein